MNWRISLPTAVAVGVALTTLSLTSVDAAYSTSSVPSTRGPAALAVGTDDPVLAAVGDMACDASDKKFNGGAGTALGCQQSKTSAAVLADTTLIGVLGLGDYQYDCGDPSDYAVSYNPTWGRLDSIMTPIAGNHEYKTGTDAFGAACPITNSSAQGFFDHFGDAAHPESNGHFSFDVGNWHLIGLNANCSKDGVGGCGATSAQTQWLQGDLASTTQPCVAAFWHQPIFTGRGKGKLPTYRPWWDALYAAHADVVLNGHTHNYQRYAPRDPSGALDPVNGITQYVVGTGGENLMNVTATAVPQPEVWRHTFGYLRIALHPDGWDSEFVDSSGTVLDTNGGTCHL